MSKYIHPIDIEAAVEVASNLLPADKREIMEGHGLDPLPYLVFEAAKGDCICFKAPSGRTAGMAGVEEGGLIWMLCTDAIYEGPIKFSRECKRYIDGREEPLLWNVVDKRNKVHMRLLKFLGCKFLRELRCGPNQLPFIEFCRVRRSSSCQSS